jgi:SNF2-related domain
LGSSERLQSKESFHQIVNNSDPCLSTIQIHATMSRQPERALREAGYFVLEDCLVDIHIDQNNHVARESVMEKIPWKRWIQVKVHHPVVQPAGDTAVDSHPSASEADHSDNSDDRESSKQCLPLILKENPYSFSASASGSLEMECNLNSELIPFFDGRLPLEDCKDIRDDSMLLLGLLRAVHPTVTICSLKVMLFQVDGVDDGSAKFRVRAALTAIIGFPFLQQDLVGSRRSILPAQPLSELDPSLQLIMACVRSNWKELQWIESNAVQIHQKLHARRLNLEEIATHMGQGSPRTQRPGFFPQQLNLETVYESIQETAISRQIDSANETGFEQASEFSTLDIVSLSLALPGVFTVHVAPLLRAAELNAFRATCHRFHFLFRAIIPGLKLNLYSHQVECLDWMRKREARQLCERTALNELGSGSTFTRGSLHSQVDSDSHRAVTGGQTVSLALRPTRDNDEVVCIRVDQRTGNEVFGDDFAHVKRQVCRGGMLCDDPGLGKTVTVLALILQTFGLRTADPPNDRMSGNAPSPARKSRDDQLFDLYWATISDFDRRCELFSFVSGLVGCAPKLEVDDVRRGIQKNSFGGSFDEFDSKMRYEKSVFCPWTHTMAFQTKARRSASDVQFGIVISGNELTVTLVATRQTFVQCMNRLS